MHLSKCPERPSVLRRAETLPKCASGLKPLRRVGAAVDNRSIGINGLTRREHDCLRHLEQGLSTTEAASALEISKSTLNAHLASTRRKLGVRNTTQALLVVVGERRGTCRQPAVADGPLNERQIALVDRLSRSERFVDAWLALHDYAETLGIFTINFWIVADPYAALDDHSCAMWSSIPDELLQIYREIGGMVTDPSGPHILSATEPLIIDPEFYLDSLKASPAPMQTMATAVIDARLNRMLSVSQRDPATGAAIGLVFSYGIRGPHEFERAVAATRGELTQTTAIFWDHVQRAALLAGAIGLSHREREALVQIARGYPPKHLAERMSVSLRAAEKFLARARAKLGAKTNAQAVYRATVYRALATELAATRSGGQSRKNGTRPRNFCQLSHR